MVPGKILQGPDVSGWQPGVQWDRVAAAGEGYFGFAKATESTYYRDSTYAGNRTGMHAAGFLLCGAYCFAQASASPEGEADFFVSQVGSLRPGEAAVLDAEVAGLSGGFASRWSARVAETAPGLRGLYCSLSYYGDVLGTPDDLIGPGLAFDFLWIAAYYTPRFDPAGALTNGPDSVPWSFWQYTDKQTLPGIEGTCDDSFYRYGLDDLRKLVGATTTPTPSTPSKEVFSMNRHLVLMEGGKPKEDWLWMGASRILSQIPADGVYAVIEAGNDCPRVEVDNATLQCFKNWASNAGFTG